MTSTAVAPAGGHADRSAPGVTGLPAVTTASACSVQSEPDSDSPGRENTDTAREPDSSAAPTSTRTGTPDGGTTSGACSVSSSTTGHPTSSPARMTSSTKPAPGNSTTPPTA